MRTVEEQFIDYGRYHQTPGNKRYHRIGIPLIMLSLFGLLAHVQILRQPIALDLAIVLIVLSEVYYLFLEWRLAIAMGLVSAALYLLGATLPVWLLWSLFVAGWIMQFIGHAVHEKKQPAFVKNLTHLLIGPLWIVNDALHIVGEKPATLSTS